MQMATMGVKEGINALSHLRRSSQILLTSALPITYVHYGRNRKTVFPEYFFCGRCNNWEIFVNIGTVGSKKRNSARNKCEAQHVNPCHPTTLKKNVIRARQVCVESSSYFLSDTDKTNLSLGDDFDDAEDTSDMDELAINDVDVIDLSVETLGVQQSCNDCSSSDNDSTGDNPSEHTNLINMMLPCTRCQLLVDENTLLS